MGRSLLIITTLLALALCGCVLAPKETQGEKNRAADAGKPYAASIEKRQVPELPSPASWRDVLQRALLSNGDLEAAYFEWKAALARVPQVASWPNSALAPSFSYMFSGGRMKSWDRSTVGLGFDPSESLELPVKTSRRGKIALAEARAAGAKFLEAKFELQRRVLVQYVELALLEERIRIGRDNVALLKLLADTAGDRVRGGGSEQDLLRAQMQYRLSENELAGMESDRRAMRAMLNAMMNRDAVAEIALPAGLPAPRTVAADDAKLIAAATAANPGLTRLARDVEGRKDAVELARLAYLPDLNPTFSFTGSVSQSIGLMAMLPSNLPRIRGAIEEARARLAASEASLRQGKSDRAGAFVAALVGMRNAEREAKVFAETILPRAEQTLASSRQAYSTGTGTFIELIDAQRTLLEVRVMIAQARAEREKKLAEMEELAGLDVETLGNQKK